MDDEGPERILYFLDLIEDPEAPRVKKLTAQQIISLSTQYARKLP